jgi:hypothetical protein
MLFSIPFRTSDFRLQLFGCLAVAPKNFFYSTSSNHLALKDVDKLQ